MKKLLRTLTAGILMMAMTVSLCSCLHVDLVYDETETTSAIQESTSTAREETTAQTTETVSDTGESTSAQTGGESSLIPKYHEIDYDAFKDDCEALEALGTSGSFDDVIALYEELHDRFVEISDNAYAAYIEYSADVTDEALNEAMESSDYELTECYDALLSALHELSTGSFGEDLEEYFGDEIFELIADYEEMTDEQLEREQRITELVSEYQTLSAELYDPYDLSVLAEQAAPIYLELVKLRNLTAKEAGYDNYAEYAYVEAFGREYSEEDVNEFRKAVKSAGSNMFSTYYDFFSYYYYYGDDEDVLTVSECLTILEKYADRIDPIAGESVEYLLTNDLYDIAEGSQRLDSSYTVELSKSPFIFINFDEYYNLDTLTHEFGHFTAMHNNENPDLLFYGSDLDISEIHSNGLELLYSHYYDEIYGADSADSHTLSLVLSGLVDDIIYGCLVDEFEWTVYENPDMTADELNSLFSRLEREYGDPYGNEGYFWSAIGHIFESPLYYISYAVSYIGALQIWEQSLDDFEGACGTWASLIKDYNVNTDYYFDVIDGIGLIPFTEKDKIASLLSDITDWCDDATGKITGRSDYSNMFNSLP